MQTKIYKIFLKRNKDGVIEDLELLREGFSLPALFFQIFFLLYKRLWKQFIICFAIMFVLIILRETFVAPFVIVPIQIALCVYIAFEYSDWISNKLLKNGYQFLGYSSGYDEKEAKLKFLDTLNSGYNKDDKLEQKIF